MILDKNIKIRIASKNKEYYENKINKKLSNGDEISISVDDLPKTSKLKVNVECDVCGDKKQISMFSYRRNISNYNFYACSQVCANEKNKKTNLDRYGEESFTKTKEYILKTKKTKKDRHGDENYVNIEKIKETCLSKYGVDSYMKTEEFKEKSILTCKSKYGVKYPLQSKEILDKLINTNLSKYGVKFVLQNEKIKEQISETKKRKYNDKNYNNREKYKKTCIEIFGVDNVMKSSFIQEKLKNNFYNKYGVFYPAQYPEFFEKMLKNGYKIKKYKDSELYYQGTYEKDFLDNYFNKIEIFRGESIRYNYDESEHIYFPDFFIKKLNLIIEIKSSKWYNEHKEKNLAKEVACKEQGFNFLFIIDKDYEIFNKMIQHIIYNKEHSWQYDIRLNTYDFDVEYLKVLNIDISKLKVSDFNFEFVDKTDTRVKDIVEFIKRYEWLGTMPNRPTHRFVMTYKNIIAGVVVMSVPNSFSNLVGQETRNIEKLISRGACASWTPKNLASSLIMNSIKWMVKNTEFRVFSAYADSEAKELGTIYQAANFIYLGKKYGATKLYFDPLKSHLGWTTGRNYSKLNFYKSYLKSKNIQWYTDWNIKTKILWNNIPNNIEFMLRNHTKECKNRCSIRKVKPKHKYVYILGSNKTETKILKNKFRELNNIHLSYPKDR